MTLFEKGQQDGTWTQKQIQQCGFTSAAECLAHQEQVYQDEKARLPDLYAINPTYAAKQAEYLEGLITAERASLK